MNAKPKLFIGSSVEGLDYARGVQANLQREAEVTVWDQDVFTPNKYTLESLVEELDKSDFAVFVFSPDDVALIRGKKHTVARDNVIFELGLFIGRLSKERTFFLIPLNQQDFRLLTDLAGITPCQFEHDRTDKNWKACTAVACESIRKALREFVPTDKRTQTDERTQTEIFDDIITQLRTLLSKQLSTEYIGLFPSYTESHICQCLEEAREEIHIVCDVFTYSAFSEPDLFKRYLSILRAKSSEGVRVRFLILNAEIREQQDRLQLNDCTTDEGFAARRKSNLNFEEHVCLLSTKAKQQINNANDFFTALTMLEVSEIEKCKGLFEFAESPNFFPIHLWVSDTKSAVFTIPKYTEDAVEHGFATTDTNLISCLRLIWNRYKVTSKNIFVV